MQPDNGNLISAQKCDGVKPQMSPAFIFYFISKPWEEIKAIVQEVVEEEGATVNAIKRNEIYKRFQILPGFTHTTFDYKKASAVHR